MFDNKSRRPRAYVGPGAELRATRVGNWFKALAGLDAAKEWCIANGVGLTKATGEGTDIAGAYLAPDDFNAAIIAIRETVGAFRRNTDVQQAKSMNQARPRPTGGVTAKFAPD